MKILWQIEEIKPKSGIFSITKRDIETIGNIYFGTKCSYYKEDFYGSFFRNTINEGILDYIFGGKKGFFIRFNSNDKNYIYIDKKGIVYRIEGMKIAAIIKNEEINNIIKRYV
jgi:hypothetical protein